MKSFFYVVVIVLVSFVCSIALLSPFFLFSSFASRIFTVAKLNEEDDDAPLE